MVFDKRPCNIREVPLYFIRKLLVEFVLGVHVNYFDITKFQGDGIGSSQDQPTYRRNPLRGSLTSRHDPNPHSQPPKLSDRLDDIDDAMRFPTCGLLIHTTFVEIS